MRVLFISKSYPTNGGVERWLSDLCYGLPVHGIRPVLCLVKGNTYHKPSKYLQVYPEIRSVETHIADGTLGSKSARIKSLKNIIKTVAPDVVVPVLLHEAIQAADTRRRRGQKLKIVYPVHENDVWVFDAVNEKKDYIDMLVCVNRLFVDVCERLLKIPKEKVRHVRCGARKPLNDQQKHNDVKIRIGYCGKLVESQKRFGDFIKICRTIFNSRQDIQILIAGSGSSESVISELLSHEIHKGRVKFFGQLTQAELYREFYPNIDILLITSDWETGPITAWEAMLHGVAIVTSAYRGIRKEGIFLNKKNSMIFPIGDFKEAARQVLALANDKFFLQTVAEEGRKLADDLLTVEFMTKQWADSLKEVTERPFLRPKVNSNKFCYIRSRAELFISEIKDNIRLATGRRIYHPSSHSEWPRYPDGVVSSIRIAEFDLMLRKFEVGTCQKTLKQ